MVVATVTSPAQAAVSISLCGPGCLCIDYTRNGGSYIEVRCTGDGEEGGWTPASPEDLDLPDGPGVPGGPGSFGGDGEPGEEYDSPPCSQVTGIDGVRLEKARESALGKLSWLGRGLDRSPTTCTALFRNSPLNLAPKAFLENDSGFHAIFRYAEGCTLPDGLSNPCSSGIAAFTTCCTHRPYIFLCRSFFEFTPTRAGESIIHEMLHIYGQKEDRTPSTGPGDPPTTHQLNDLVRQACRSPQPIPRGD